MKPVVFLLLIIALCGHRVLDVIPFEWALCATAAAVLGIGYLFLRERIQTRRRMREYSQASATQKEDPWYDCPAICAAGGSGFVRCIQRQGHEGEHHGAGLNWGPP